MKRVSLSWTAILVTPLFLALGGALCVPEEEIEEELPTSEGKLIKATCDRALRCEAEQGRSFVDEETCVDTFNDLLSCGYYVDFGFVDVELRFRIDEAGSGECISWLESADCAEDDDGGACADWLRVVDGEGEGESCQSDLGAIRFCDAGLYCDDEQADGICSVCIAKPGVGGSCSLEAPEIECDENSYCDPADNRCAAFKAYGDACQSHAACSPGWCDDGTCAAPLERNATCAEGDLCRGALRCHEGVCTDQAGPGQPCEDGGDCVGGTVCMDGTCEQVDLCTPATVGDPCLMRCEEGAYCEDNRCVAHRGEGESCAASLECGFPAAACDSDTSTCETYQQLGDPCGADQQCIPFENYCDFETDPQSPVCAVSKAAGQPCGTSFECASWHCDPVSDTCAYQSEICELP